MKPTEHAERSIPKQEFTLPELEAEIEACAE